MSKRDKNPLPRYVFWEFRGNAWGEAFYSVLHGQPIRTFIIPERIRQVINLWGPNGRITNSRFNKNRLVIKLWGPNGRLTDRVD